jgi:hypothetical protein
MVAFAPPARLWRVSAASAALRLRRTRLPLERERGRSERQFSGESTRGRVETHPRWARSPDMSASNPAPRVVGMHPRWARSPDGLRGFDVFVWGGDLGVRKK